MPMIFWAEAKTFPIKEKIFSRRGGSRTAPTVGAGSHPPLRAKAGLFWVSEGLDSSIFKYYSP